MQLWRKIQEALSSFAKLWFFNKKYNEYLAQFSKCQSIWVYLEQIWFVKFKQIKSRFSSMSSFDYKTWNCREKMIIGLKDFSLLTTHWSSVSFARVVITVSDTCHLWNYDSTCKLSWTWPANLSKVHASPLHKGEISQFFVQWIHWWYQNINS